MPQFQLLTAATPIYVTGRDGTSQMTFRSFCDAYKGGLKLDEVELTFDEEYSKKLEAKREAVQEVNHLMRSMSPRQSKTVVNILRSSEDLMNIEEDERQ